MDRVYTTPLLDKLGVRPGVRIALIEIHDESLGALLAGRTTDITEGWPLSTSPAPLAASITSTSRSVAASELAGCTIRACRTCC